MSLRLNDRVRLPDGRVGTICYRFLDGEGGVWGERAFAMPDGGFGDELPAPEFLLRDPALQPLLAKHHGPDIECVGIDYEVIAQETR